MISFDEFNLLDFIPQSLKNNSDVKILCEIFSEEIQEIYQKKDKLFLFNFESLSKILLDELAYQEHIDYYDTSLSKNQKKELISNAFKNHLKKGTKYAVETALKTVFNDFTLSEWFEYKGKPYHFKVVQDISDKKTDELLNEAQSRKIINFINEYKNIRSICDGFIKLVIASYKNQIKISSKTEIITKSKHGFYKLKLNGLWKLNGNSNLGLYEKGKSDYLKYGYRAIQSNYYNYKAKLNGLWELNGELKLKTEETSNFSYLRYGYKGIKGKCSPTLKLDGSWKLNGNSDLGTYETIKFDYLKYSYRAVQSNYYNYKAKLNGLWKLNGELKLKTEETTNFSYLRYGYKGIKGKCSPTLKLDGSWKLNGNSDLGTYETIKFDYLKYSYLAIQSSLRQMPYLFIDGSWKFNAIEQLDGINNDYPYKLNKTKVIKYREKSELILDGTWSLAGNQKFNGSDAEYPSKEM